jgi:hypothetical protein
MLPAAKMDYAKVHPAHEGWGEGVGWVCEGNQGREEEEFRATFGGAWSDS